MEKLKIGIIGIGVIATTKHITYLLKREDVEVVALCDIDTAKAEKAKESGENKDNEKKKIEVAQEYVFLYDKGVAKMVKVKTGIQDNTYIQIIEGVKEGQEVITAPYRAVSKKLKDGDKVTKVDAKDLYADEKK